MIRFQRVNGVNLENSNGLPTIQRTPEGIAMGAVPGWVEFIDPSHIDISARTARNRARSRSHFPVLSSDLPLGVFPGSGKTAFAPTNEHLLRVDSVGVALNPEEFSFFVVAHPTATSSNLDDLNLIRGLSATPLGEIGLRVSIFRDTGALHVLERSEPPRTDNPSRLAYNGKLIERNKPCLLMVTFSVADGLRIFDNGVQVAEKPSDKRPLTRSWQADDRCYFRGCRGFYGESGLLNIDLGRIQNTGHRRAIERFLMSKYGINV